MHHPVEHESTSVVQPVLFGVLLLVVCVVAFRPLLEPGAVLFTSDDNIGHMTKINRVLPAAFTGVWHTDGFVGRVLQVNPGWTNLIRWAFPPELVQAWLRAVDLLLASGFLALFLRMRGVAWPACCVGAVSAFWLGGNFTLVYAGHIAKFGILVFAAGYLWLFELARRTRYPGYAVLAGGAFGAMFLEQPDVALYFATVLGPYTVFTDLRHARTHPRTWLKCRGIVFVVAMLFAAHPLSVGYESAVRDVAILSEGSETFKWEFATQWSWPPGESLEFVLPGYFGHATGHADGPYRGVIGRSAGWTETGTGLGSFKLESYYLGAMPLLLAAWALWSAAFSRARDSIQRDALLWGGLVAAGFALACGKFLPLYEFLYPLPGFSSVRNPMKLLAVVQMAAGILAAYGLHALLAGQRPDALARRTASMQACFLAMAVAGLVGLFGLLLHQLAHREAAVEAFVIEGFSPAAADLIVSNMRNAIVHGMVFAGAALAAFGYLLYGPNPARFAIPCAWALAALVAVDAVLLSRHYVRAMDASLLEGDPVVDSIKAGVGDQRIAFASEAGDDPFRTNWLFLMVPYHDLATVDYAHAPRIKRDYVAYTSALRHQALRAWQLGAVKYVLATTGVCRLLGDSPQFRGTVRQVLAFDAVAVPPGVFRSGAKPADEHATRCVLEILRHNERYRLVGDWLTVPDEAALRHLGGDVFRPEERVLLAPHRDAPPSPARAVAEAGWVEVVQRTPVKVSLLVQARGRALLRIADQYDPAWKASIDGQPATVLRGDFLFQALDIPAGLHAVELELKPSRTTVWLPVLGAGLCVVTALLLPWRRQRRGVTR